MKVHTYRTGGGKDLIRDYLDKLDIIESVEGYLILEELEKRGLDFLDTLDTRQIENKLWEIKFRRHNRLFYVLIDKDNIYLLHACKKQKGKAEQHDLDKARNRADKIK
ncbi:MAG: type II toxin-antitoxin system RelE/ParE family toxin [Anaerovoracaceae bacterium]|jgi:phage-related protein